eukprot:gene3302-2284_t
MCMVLSGGLWLSCGCDFRACLPIVHVLICKFLYGGHVITFWVLVLSNLFFYGCVACVMGGVLDVELIMTVGCLVCARLGCECENLPHYDTLLRCLCMAVMGAAERCVILLTGMLCAFPECWDLGLDGVLCTIYGFVTFATLLDSTFIVMHNVFIISCAVRCSCFYEISLDLLMYKPLVVYLRDMGICGEFHAIATGPAGLMHLVTFVIFQVNFGGILLLIIHRIRFWIPCGLYFIFVLTPYKYLLAGFLAVGIANAEWILLLVRLVVLPHGCTGGCNCPTICVGRVVGLVVVVCGLLWQCSRAVSMALGTGGWVFVKLTCVAVNVGFG